MPQGNVSMLGEGGGGAAPIMPRNAVGGAAGAPQMQMPQQQNSGLEALQMAKLVRDMQAKQGSGDSNGGTGNLFGAKGGGGGNGAAAQQSASSMGTMGGGM